MIWNIEKFIESTSLPNLNFFLLYRDVLINFKVMKQERSIYKSSFTVSYL